MRGRPRLAAVPVLRRPLIRPRAKRGATFSRKGRRVFALRKGGISRNLSPRRKTASILAAIALHGGTGSRPACFGKGGRRRDGVPGEPRPGGTRKGPSGGHYEPPAGCCRLHALRPGSSEPPRREEEWTSRVPKSPCGARDERHITKIARRSSRAPLPPRGGNRTSSLTNLRAGRPRERLRTSANARSIRRFRHRPARGLTSNQPVTY